MLMTLNTLALMMSGKYYVVVVEEGIKLALK